MHEDEEQSRELVDDREVEFDMSTYLASKAGEQVERSDTDSINQDQVDEDIFNQDRDNFLLLLQKFENEFKTIHHKTSIIDFWKEQKENYPEIYAVAEILNSIPPSQATVERSFSALAYIYGPLRCRLSKDILSDILMIKLNKGLLRKIFAKELLDLEKKIMCCDHWNE